METRGVQSHRGISACQASRQQAARRHHTASDSELLARAVTTAVAATTAAPVSFTAPSATGASCSMLLLVPISSRRELDIASVSEAEGERLPAGGGTGSVESACPEVPARTTMHLP